MNNRLGYKSSYTNFAPNENGNGNGNGNGNANDNENNWQQFSKYDIH